MAQYVPEILLWLFVINLGIAFGAGLYEQRIVLPQWFNSSSEPGLRVDSAAMRSADTGRRFWAFVSTGPLTLLTLANLVVAWESQGQRHEWWLGAAVTTLEAMASQWMAVNHVRAALTLLGWLAALKTLSLPA